MAHKHWQQVLDYANGIRSGVIVANMERRQAAERFLKDLDNPAYEIKHEGPEFCIGIIQTTLCHQQGEDLQGRPLRGTPFLLEPWEKFIVYNLVGFYHAGTSVVRFHESLIFVPRKNGKTGFAAALAWSLSLWYRKSGSKCYITSAALMQSLDAFNFLDYNVDRMGEKQIRGKKGGLIAYLRGVRQEIKKVVWPTREELTTDTIVVFACVIFFAVAFWLIDTGFLAALKGILGITLS